MFTIRHRREVRQPVPDERVTALLDAAAAPTEPGPAPGEAAALAAFREAHQAEPSPTPRVPSPPSPLRTAAAAAIGAGVLLTGGVAAAQAGALPGAAQDVARHVLDKVGVSVPGADERSAPDEHGASTDAPRQSGGADTATTGQDEATDRSGKGSDISDLARQTTGVHKGWEISTKASGGKSQAGQHGKAEARGQADSAPGRGVAGEHARVTTPNSDGTDHPDHARSGARDGGSSTGGGAVAARSHAPLTVPNRGGAAAHRAPGRASATGRAIADAASGGRSATGSGQHP